MPSTSLPLYLSFPSSNGELDPAGFEASTPGVPVVNMAEMKMPARLPQGLVHLSLDKVALYMAPLPSLSVTYSVSHKHFTAWFLIFCIPVFQ